jgi:general secretion pathway protein K
MYPILDVTKKPGKIMGSTAREEGAVLLLVLMILTLISVLVLSWAQEWRTELKLASNFGEAHKGHRLAEAGIYYALGKLVLAKAAEANRLQPVGSQTQKVPGELWQGDQQPHVLELPDGKVEIRIGDESGKININFAPEGVLSRFFAGLGIAEPQIRTMVDSIQDWRAKGDSPRPYGAKSAYYLGLDPPYVAKNSHFETVEELAWVRGFEASPWIPRLSQWLTVQVGDRSINVNTAPLEVLQAVGFSRGAAQNIMVSRQAMPFRNFQEIPQPDINLALGQSQKISFRSAPFFTITSTGMVKKTKGRQTIKAIVRVDINNKVPWMILSWYDGFPG